MFPSRNHQKKSLPWWRGGADYGCELGVTDVSLDGCLSADLASVAGGVGRRRPRGIVFLLAGVVLASMGPFVGD